MVGNIEEGGKAGAFLACIGHPLHGEPAEPQGERQDGYLSDPEGWGCEKQHSGCIYGNIAEPTSPGGGVHSNQDADDGGDHQCRSCQQQRCWNSFSNQRTDRSALQIRRTKVTA